MLNRAKILTPTQNEQVEELLRHNHDMFAKDDSSFGNCPRVKFRIDTGDAKPVKQATRPIPLHNRQAV